jgi:ribosomal protein L37AE/L43A
MNTKFCQKCAKNKVRRLSWCSKCRHLFVDEYKQLKLQLKEKLKNTFVNKKCKICSNLVKIKFYSGTVICDQCKGTSKSSAFFKTRNEKTLKTIRLRYNVDNCFLVKSDNGDELKRVKTCQERYGVDNPLQNKDIYNKAQQTNLKKYGYKNPFENVDKLKITWTKKYGVTNPNKTLIIRQKIEKTNQELYGVKNPAQNIDIKNKIISTNLKRYGYKHVLQVPEIMKKRFDKKHLTYSKVHAKLKNKIVDKIKNQNFETECIITCKHEHFSIDEYDKSRKIIIFVDGDYWHANPLKYQKNYYFSTMNKTAEQIHARDEYVSHKLTLNGFIVLRFWESQINNDIDICISTIDSTIKNIDSLNLRTIYENEKDKTIKKECQNVK